MKNENCICCGKKLARKGRKFCNHDCQKEHEYKTWIQEWLEGKHDGLRGEYQISKHIKRYLFELHDNKCQECCWGKMNPHTGNIPLEIEHNDGNYLNNRPENLSLLCPNCHSLTSTYKGSNKGNGRKQRKKYTLD